MRLALILWFWLSSAANAAPLTVFAAASLTDAFTELGKAFDLKTGHQTRFQFAGSQTLKTQLENGARADLYVSANRAQYDPLVKNNLLEPGQILLRNRLALIVPKTSTRVRSLADLTQPGIKLVLADKTVPAGDYTRRMFEVINTSSAYGRDFATRALKNVVSEEPNVRQVALKVSLGEADAALVYQSDLTPNLKNTVRAITLPMRFNQTALYPIGMVRASPQPEAARAFTKYALSPEGQRILKKWGFLSPQ
jgi:molybdate transport system substrate-binding protein